MVTWVDLGVSHYISPLFSIRYRTCAKRWPIVMERAEHLCPLFSRRSKMSCATSYLPPIEKGAHRTYMSFVFYPLENACHFLSPSINGGGGRALGARPFASCLLNASFQNRQSTFALG